MRVSNTVDGSIDRILDRLDRLERENRSLRESNDELRAAVGVAGSSEATVRADAPDHEGTSQDGRLTRRRLLLGGAGAAAAGAVAMVSSATPAAAANGDPILIGSSGNAGTLGTGLSMSGVSTTYGFGVSDNGYGGNFSGFKPALWGHAANATLTAGIYGVGYVNGIVGETSSADVNAVGVLGRATAGVGVQGQVATSNPGIAVKGSSAGGSSAVLGENTDIANEAYSVFGRNDGLGVGVMGWTTSSSNARSGVVGRQAGAVGIGVLGEVINSSGTGPAVLGQHVGAGPAVRGYAIGTGEAFYGTVPAGSSANGIYSENAGAGAAVYGAATGTGFGVVGEVIKTTSTAPAIITKNAGLGVGLLSQIVNASSAAPGVRVTTSGSGNGAELIADHAQLLLNPTTGSRQAPVADVVSHFRGEVLADGNGDLWYCVTTGTPGTWRKLSGASTAGAFHVLPTPVRVYDSRPGTSPSQGPKTPLAANVARPLDLTFNNSKVPPGATAALVTILLVNAAIGNGNFTVWANGAAKPLSNSMVWGGSIQRFSGSAVTALDGDAKVQVSASAATDLVLDVVGYYR